MHKRLGEILISHGIINNSQLENALDVQNVSKFNERLGQILISAGIISYTELAQALAEQFNINFIKLDRLIPAPEIIKLIPKNMAQRFEIIPVEIDDENFLHVAVIDPVDITVQDEIKNFTGLNLKISVAAQDELLNSIDRIYDFDNNIKNAVARNSGDNSNPEEAPIIKLVDDLISQAVAENASDVHAEIYSDLSRIRFRVDGVLYTAFEYPVSVHPAIVSRIKIMSKMDIAEKRKPQDGRILTTVNNKNIDLRISSLPVADGEKIVMRILYQDEKFAELESLGLEQQEIKIINEFCNLPHGIILITGPTGSGKSTTLYAMLKKLNNPDTNIITVEDPVEFHINGVNQVQLNEKAGVNFETALRAILRQDPDKIMIGEIRDSITAQIAVRSALTGHLVLSTLHTNDAPSAITRIIDMKIPPFLISAALVGVIAQRLVRKLCPNCRKKYLIDDDPCNLLEIPRGAYAFKPEGCSKCRNGYKGRTAIFEIMHVNNELRKFILNDHDTDSLRNIAIKNGMNNLRKSGINLALKGVTSLEEILIATV